MELNILIVEDQYMTLDAVFTVLRIALRNKHITCDFTYTPESHPAKTDVANPIGHAHILISKSFNDAKKVIESAPFDIVFLDHRMPYDDLGDLEKTNMSAFSAKLQDIGYTLAPEIHKQNKKCIIVGTSSLTNLPGSLKQHLNATIVKYQAWDSIPQFEDFIELAKRSKE